MPRHSCVYGNELPEAIALRGKTRQNLTNTTCECKYSSLESPALRVWPAIFFVSLLEISVPLDVHRVSKTNWSASTYMLWHATTLGTLPIHTGSVRLALNLLLSFMVDMRRVMLSSSCRAS